MDGLFESKHDTWPALQAFLAVTRPASGHPSLLFKGTSEFCPGSY